jgi:hypothetical protein
MAGIHRGARRGGSMSAILPLAVYAQQLTLQMAGFLALGTLGRSVDDIAAFRKGPSEMGYAEGRNSTLIASPRVEEFGFIGEAPP